MLFVCPGSALMSKSFFSVTQSPLIGHHCGTLPFDRVFDTLRVRHEDSVWPIVYPAKDQRTDVNAVKLDTRGRRNVAHLDQCR